MSSGDAPGRIATSAYVLACLAALAGALTLGGAGGIALVALVVVASTLVLLRPSLAGFGIAMSSAFAATTTWDAVGAGPIQLGDVFLVLGLGAFVLAATTGSGHWPRLPSRILLLALAIIVVAFVNEVLPFDANYLAHRVFLDSNGLPTVVTQSNIGIVVRWIIALVGVALLMSFAARWSATALERVGMAYAVGAAISGWVAVSDRIGATHIAATLGYNLYGTRQTGLAQHPNLLSAPSTLAAPFACWMIATRTGWTRLVGVFALGGVGMGTYFSGSRGGAVVIAVVVVVSFLLLRELRARIIELTTALAVGVFVVLLRSPDAFQTITSTTRLSGSGSAAGADEARRVLAAQADQDFAHSPIYGIGLQVALVAHNIYRQALASGGVVLFGFFAGFLVLTVVQGSLLARRNQLMIAAVISMVAWMMLGTVENYLTDRYLYVAASLVAATWSSTTGRHDHPPDEDDASRPAADAPAAAARTA